MSNYIQDISTPYSYNGIAINPIFGAAINAFAERDPLFSRLEMLSLGAMQFTITSDNYRPNSTTINHSGGYNTSDTSIVVADGTEFMAGDVIEFLDTDNTYEQLLVTAVSSNTLTVTRAYGSTTAKSLADTAVVYLVGNTRTGGEVDQLGISRIPATVVQNSQVFQHPYQVGGAVASQTNLALPPGFSNIIGRERAYAMQNCADDVERSFYYGKGVTLAATTTRPQMKGLRVLISTNTTSAPTNGSAYKPSDLIRDTIQKCYASGGKPTLLLVSTDFMAGMSVWGQAVERLDAGETMFGTPIDQIFVPWLGGLQLAPAPLLRAGTVICLSSSEVFHRVKRAMFDKPRGSRGDAEEGDIIHESAIELVNEAHHAWVTGITGFAAA